MTPPAFMLAATLLFAAPLCEVRTPVHRPVTGESLSVCFEHSIELELGEVEMTLIHDGKELEWWMFPIYHELDAQRALEITEEFLIVEQGEPRKLRRFYDEINEERTYTLLERVKEMPDGAAPLERETILFERDEHSSWRVRPEREERDLPPEALARLVPDIGLGEWLPPGDAEPGADWKLPGAVLPTVLEAGGRLDFGEPTEKLGPHDPFDSRLFDALEGELECVYTSIEEADGRRIAIIAIEGRVRGVLELSLSGKVARLGDDVRLEGEEETEAEIRLEVDGELRWNLDDQRMQSLQLELEIEIEEEIHSASPDGRWTGDYSGSWSGSWVLRARRAN